MADQLTWDLCDPQGARLAALEDTLSGQVTIGVNDIRNGTVGLSLEDPAVAIIQSQETRLKAFLGDQIILNAPVFLPSYAGGSDTPGAVEVSATDNVRLATAFLIGAGFSGFALTGVDPAEMMALLVEHADGQDFVVIGGPIALAGASVASHGIIRGSLPATAATSRTYWDGTNIWTAILELVASDDGCDFELEPLDRTDGVFAQLNTFNRRQGTDRSGSVIFEVGTGEDNATGWSWQPSREQLLNFYVLYGQSDDTGLVFAYIAQHGDSQDQFGLYQGFESDADLDTSDYAAIPTGPNALAAAARARQVVAGRAYPIDFFSITPAVEQGGTAVGWARDPSGELVVTGEGYGVPPRFAPDGDYWLGDTITAVVKEGEMQGSFPARVTTATITEVDQAGNVAVELGCTPPDRYSAGVTGEFQQIHVGPASLFSAQGSEDTGEPAAEPGGGGTEKLHDKRKHKKHKHHHKKHH